VTDDAVLDALLEAVGLKDVARAGWVRRGVPQVESVAAHSWGVAWLVLVLLPPGLDRARALTYAILHDLPEVRVGDLTPFDGVPRHEKHRREAAALESLAAPLPASIADAWRAYEAQGDEEARFVRQLDRLDLAIQAVAYAPRTPGALGDFLDSARSAIHDPRLVRLVEALASRLRASSGGADEKPRTP
jgi:putative hydrolase of HD superfamily